MIEVATNVTRLFFDKKHVQDRLGKAKAKAMGRSLAYIQRTAQNSMRRRKKASDPGDPPSRHFGGRDQGLGRIWFFYEEQAERGIVGPIKFRSGMRSNWIMPRPVPSTLEFGASVLSKTFAYDSKWRRISKDGTVTYYTPTGKRKTRKAKPRYYRSHPAAPTRRVTIAFRPFMSHALLKAVDKGKVIGEWAGTVTNG